ncbi:MAG: DUF3307 domain-containing protein [Candidatus Zhuqueibacterota bacterium]
MNVFWYLILAHLIADFPLQSDKIYAIRLKHKWGVLLHVGIYFITNLVVAFPFLSFKQFWFAILFLAITHLIEDWTKIALTRKALQDSIVLFFVDQFIHIFFIWLSCFVLFDIPAPEITNQFVQRYYFNSHIIFMLIGLVFSVFAGVVLIYYVRKCVHRIKFSNDDSSVQFPKIKKRRIGYIERLFSTSGVILGGWFLILLPLAFLPRLIISKDRELEEFLLINLLTGLAISIGSGVFVHVASYYFG